ncbi:hypothetical protein NN561_015668 [Cricetulus griseus]
MPSAAARPGGAVLPRSGFSGRPRGRGGRRRGGAAEGSTDSVPGLGAGGGLQGASQQEGEELGGVGGAVEGGGRSQLLWAGLRVAQVRLPGVLLATAPPTGPAWTWALVARQRAGPGGARGSWKRLTVRARAGERRGVLRMWTPGGLRSKRTKAVNGDASCGHRVDNTPSPSAAIGWPFLLL